MYARTCNFTSEADIYSCFRRKGNGFDTEEAGDVGDDNPYYPKTHAQVCAGSAGKQNNVRAVRFGPFVSTPKLGWRDILVSPLTPTLLREGDRIVAFSGMPTTRAGVPIGYPPLHNHHIHVRKGDSYLATDRTAGSHWFETHGDYADGVDHGGVGAASTIGYVRRLPAGYCFKVDQEIVDMEGIVNDVRDPSAHGHALEWYLQLAFELSAYDETRGDGIMPRMASKLWWRHPWSVEPSAWADWWARYSVPNHESLTWWSGYP